MKSMAQLEATTKSPSQRREASRRQSTSVRPNEDADDADEDSTSCRCNDSQKQKQQQQQLVANESGNIARAALAGLLTSSWFPLSPLLAPIVKLFSSLVGAPFRLICLISNRRQRRRRLSTKKGQESELEQSYWRSFFEHLERISTKMASGFCGQPASCDEYDEDCDEIASQQEQSSIVTVTSKFSRTNIQNSSRPGASEKESDSKRDAKKGKGDQHSDGQSNRLAAKTTSTEQEEGGEAGKTSEQAGEARAPEQQQQHQQLLQPPTGQQGQPSDQQEGRQQRPVVIERASKQLSEQIIQEAMDRLLEQDEESSLKSEELELVAVAGEWELEGQVGGGRQVGGGDQERTDTCGQKANNTSTRIEQEEESESAAAGVNSESLKQSEREEESDVVVSESSSDHQKVLAEEEQQQVGGALKLEDDDEQNQQMQQRKKEAKGACSSSRSKENADHETLEETEGTSVDCCVIERVGGQVANGTLQAREALVGHERANLAQKRENSEGKGEGKVRAVAATVDLSQDADDDQQQSEVASPGGGFQSAERQQDKDNNCRRQQQVAVGEDLRTSDWKTMAKRVDQEETGGEHSNRQQLAPVLAIGSNSCSPDSSCGRSGNYKRQSANVSEIESDSAEMEDEMDSSSCAGSNSLDGSNNRNASTNLNCNGQQQQRADYLNANSNQERQHQHQFQQQLLEGQADEDRDDNDECCAEAASDLNLRKLKLDTIEDVLVCEQNRDSLDAARRLFGSLVIRQQQHKQDHHDDNHNLQTEESISAKCDHKRAACVGVGVFEEDDEEELKRFANLSSPSPLSSADDEDNNSFGGVKIVRNKNGGSSASSSTNFRQTLVCSVSPTSQLGDSSSDVSSTTNANNNNDIMTATLAPTSTGGSHPLYPIDGDEIRQCRTAFRENKRLIQEQQDRASRAEARSNEHSERSTNASSASSRASSRQRDRFERDYKRQLSQSTCSRCQQRVYPVDKLELDFTRATLNIHRNCFKCQVCSSLLRLETYSAIDAKLYCPAHIKCVTPGR